MTAPAGPPKTVADLHRRISQVAAARGQTARRLHDTVAGIALCQLLPGGAIKGGTGLKLRFGDAMTRETPDVDAALRSDIAEFVDGLRDNLMAGWGGFTGTAVLGETRAPDDVPRDYVMQPLTVQLVYARKVFARVEVEIGYDELNATAEPPELRMADDVRDLFLGLGLDEPAPVPVLPAHHQIAQKLHACTAPGSTRAHDLVDIQLLAPQAEPAQVVDAARRLFRFRKQHLWPPAVVPGEDWGTLYAEAAIGLPVAANVAAAAVWTNGYIKDLHSR